ncbi:HlyD family efflux transporter periplasmic adaptor subunit [Leptolyngbya cf. ectocarpi LEGE 11479]|uniref:HlyD family efflux transporter periplasmic adaptor subunit n=1 Tax=Leptolyngbya cf. ectocarpi LEGE 11479 TaxID=1828722 RepID=A0A929FBJ0_LEPEC|nr:HlyD family efflux transporter periplasmic adaptor subunit [Leptolyngbya ectocarpi]MBE9069172.1 HlyD family efflux transporter periplasmic adaptor subunit [Leptolyngbya cf. ectocarpi LEGE 11479]
MAQVQKHAAKNWFRGWTKDTPAQAVKRLPRWLPYGLAGLGIAVLVALAFRPTPIPVDVGTVTMGPLQVTVDAEGQTRVKDRYVVSAPVDGRLLRIDLDAGDPVQTDAVVAQIDPLPLDTRVRAAQARLQQLRAELVGVDTQRPKPEALAQATARLQATQATQQATVAEVEETRVALEQARRDRNRAQELESRGAISRQARETAELEVDRLEQELAADEKRLGSAIANATAVQEALSLLREEQRDPDYLEAAYRAQISGVEAELANLVDEARRTTIAAPISGTVLRVPDESARFVQAGDPLIELGNPGELELVIDVLSTDAVQIKPGDQIIVEQWGGAEPLAATVSYIEPAAFTEVSALGVEEQRVNVIGTLTESAINSLGDRYRIEARIVIWADDNALQVPVSALYRCGETWCVFVVEDDRAQPREIAIDHRSTVAAEVTNGLAAEESVVLHPSEQLEAGRQVKPR